jgi:oligopeptide/dipeptide ABC transporter ATP-binding protein
MNEPTTERNDAGTAGPLLQVRGLRTHFFLRRGVVRAVNGVDLEVNAGEAVGIVGESGSGKSMTMASILGLVPPPGRIVAGEVLFEGRDLTKLSRRELARIRGRDISLVTQDPLTSLDPVFTVGYQIGETLSAHTPLRGRQKRGRVIELLDAVKIPDPRRRVESYPHQLSGGMRQRVVAAIAVSCRPKLIIADEPTSALDVTIQAQFLALLDEIRRERGTAILLITHDLGVVARLCDKIAVMYGGRIVEWGTAEDVLLRAQHPYTRALLNAMPELDSDTRRLPSIEGAPPNPLDLPAGCAFAPRCRVARPQCVSNFPPQTFVGDDEVHYTRCWATNDREWSAELQLAYAEQGGGDDATAG